MAFTVGVGIMSSTVGCSWMINQRPLKKGKKTRVCCYSASEPSYSLREHYKMLRIQPGASQKEVKKAFRQLALQYHPDVCKESNGGVQFHQINEAYDVVMSNLRGEQSNRVGFYEPSDQNNGYDYDEESTRGMCDPDWDLWEEWMGWEGAGIRDYSSHINPYI